jgi:protein transport protein SEC23
MLNREKVDNGLMMVKPTLTRYDIHGNSEIVALDVESISADRISVMDCFFFIVIYHGNVRLILL